MPRDLSLEEKPVALMESPNSTEDTERPEEGQFVLLRDNQDHAAVENPLLNPFHLHPYTRPLTISDLESCVALEEAAFTEQERCSREKFIYRLNTCGELSLGLFCTATSDSNIQTATLKSGRPVETGRKGGAVSVLLAHVIATRSNAEVVTDEAMDFPRDSNSSASTPDSEIGHREDGRSICVHSLAVVPGFQGRLLGRTLMTAYMQQMNGAGIADRIALIAHDHLVPFYEKIGFQNKGQSKAQFGGGGWIDMVFELKPVEARAMYG